jgi:hypothetical protein
MLELLVVFTVPFVAFLWAVHKFFDDHTLGARIAAVGMSIAVAGMLVALMDIERFQAECTIQSIVHNVTLPCKVVPNAYRVLVPALYVATALNAGVVVAGVAISFYRLGRWLGERLKKHSEPGST